MRDQKVSVMNGQCHTRKPIHYHLSFTSKPSLQAPCVTSLYLYANFSFFFSFLNSKTLDFRKFQTIKLSLFSSFTGHISESANSEQLYTRVLHIRKQTQNPSLFPIIFCFQRWYILKFVNYMINATGPYLPGWYEAYDVGCGIK